MKAETTIVSQTKEFSFAPVKVSPLLFGNPNIMRRTSDVNDVKFHGALVPRDLSHFEPTRGANKLLIQFIRVNPDALRTWTRRAAHARRHDGNAIILRDIFEHALRASRLAGQLSLMDMEISGS